MQHPSVACIGMLRKQLNSPVTQSQSHASSAPGAVFTCFVLGVGVGVGLGEGYFVSALILAKMYQV